MTNPDLWARGRGMTFRQALNRSLSPPPAPTPSPPALTGQRAGSPITPAPMPAPASPRAVPIADLVRYANRDPIVALGARLK